MVFKRFVCFSGTRSNILFLNKLITQIDKIMSNRARDIFSNGIQAVITALLISVLVTIFGNYTQTQANTGDIAELKKIIQTDMKSIKDDVGNIKSDVAVVRNNDEWIMKQVKNLSEEIDDLKESEALVK